MTLIKENAEDSSKVTCNIFGTDPKGKNGK